MNENVIDQATTLKLLEVPSTQMGNAERLHVLLGEDFKYVPELKCWLQWNGRFWEAQEENAMMLNVGNAARDLSCAIQLLPNSNDRKEMLHRQAVCDNLLKLERGNENKSVLDFLAGLASVKYKTFDANPFLLNVQNGTLNLLTGELQPHNKTDYLTKICAVAYDRKILSESNALTETISAEKTLCNGSMSAESVTIGEMSVKTDSIPSGSLWEQTVNTILPDPEVRRWMQKFIGYCLTGSTEEEKFVVAYGPGGSGKGTFFETIGAAIGEYKDVLPVDTLLTTNIYNGGQGPSPELAKLQGKRYVLSSESNRCRHLDEAKIKLLTGGDTITARHLGTAPVTYRPTFKLIIQTNYLPSISDAMDKGLSRRLVVVPFNATIENRDKKLKQKLLRRENLEACLAWCVEGAKLWQQEGLDDKPTVLAEAADSFYQENDLIQEWLDERTEPSLGGMKFSRALADFNDWLRLCGYHTWQKKCFAEAMKLHGKEKTRWGQGYVYSGLRLRSECAMS
ncbi:MAG: hypothetical protein IJV46_01445 [Acidaminococcaceae bacterium]|nr:hypothetical protein [Acidaminococcaceae bacterium]